MKAIYLLPLLALCSFAPADSDLSKTYSFGSYTVVTGFCGEQSQISIVKSDKVIFKDCSGDGFYSLVDTLNLNTDNQPEFIYAYASEDFYTIGILASGNNTYRKISLPKQHTSPNSFMLDMAMKKEEQEIEFILTDVNKDGKKDLVANLKLNGKTYSAVRNYTDTIYNKDLVKAIQ